MFEHCWLIVAARQMLRRPAAALPRRVVSHRLLRYGSGILHLVLLATSLALAGHGRTTPPSLAGQLAFAGLALAGAARAVPGAGLAYYYLLVTWATVVALRRLPASGVPAVWEKAEGTR